MFSYFFDAFFFVKKGEMLMVTTENDMMDFIEEYDVKFIRLAFFDLLGRQKNISVMPK